MCALPIDGGSGGCEAAYRQWGLDKEMKACREFSYNGCGGNDNNFSTKEECMEHCDPSKESLCVRKVPTKLELFLRWGG